MTALRAQLDELAESTPQGIWYAAAAVAAGILLGYQTTAAPYVLAGAGAALALAALAFFSLPAGLVILTFALFFELVPGIGGTNLTVVKIVALLVTASWLARVVDFRSGTRLLFVEHRLFAVVVCAFLVWCFASTAWADNPDTATSFAMRMTLVASLSFVTFSAVNTPRYLYWVLWAFCLGAACTTAYGLLRGDSIMGRLSGGVTNPNELAAFLAPALVIGMFLFAAWSGFAPRLLLLLANAVIFLGIALTQTRGAMVGLAVALAVGLFYAGPVRPVFAALALVVLAGAVGFYAGVATPAERDRLTDLSASGSSGRADEWRIALRMAGDEPVRGVGLGNFPIVEPRYLASSISLLRADRVLEFPPAHNMYLQVLSELGVVGSLLFTSILVGALVIGVASVRTLARGPDRRLEIVGRGVVIGYCCLLATNVFNNGLVHKQLWLSIGLLCALSTLAAANRRNAPSARAGETARTG
jgi:O-antigen ligase